MKSVVALIVAAGRGERFGLAGGPKQYRKIGGQSVLQHTINAFVTHPKVDAVQVVIHADDGEPYQQAVAANPKLLPPVNGGATRQDSVRAGLEALADKGFDIVLIHDAARPFVNSMTIAGVVDAVAEGRGAIAAQAVTDTIKSTDGKGRVTGNVSRDQLVAAQTPQGFLLNEILAAHELVASKAITGLTDDAMVAAEAGMQAVTIPSPSSNFKITLPEDLQRAEMMLGHSQLLPDIRCATGYDVHQLEPGDHVVLCGISIPHHQRLKGHSDADVGLHALTDALLGTIGAGDIGSHFPPSDPQWRGASSDRFLQHALELVRNAGGMITNLDVSLICEAPKIGPHRDTMRARIAEIAGVESFRVSVKATTNEGIGFVGREEGIAAIATATAVFMPTGANGDAD